ncbi:SIS domain-containing protein [Ectothiorhodospiraceae bacterium BW-2]|nr:SIS domain-containing protein [Ectothiorhodospiraceae bacterium BW-2]
MLFTERNENFFQRLQQAKFTNADGGQIELETAITTLLQQLINLRSERRRLFVIGNGGSAAVAGHIVNDFCNTGGLIASTIHEPALLTCYSNDYGYEQGYSRQLQTQFSSGDMLIAISSSGESANILNAVAVAIEQKGFCLTLSGFEIDNSLKKLGDINYWLPSCYYGEVEIGHLFMLHHIADCLSQC